MQSKDSVDDSQVNKEASPQQQQHEEQEATTTAGPRRRKRSLSSKRTTRRIRTKTTTAPRRSMNTFKVLRYRTPLQSDRQADGTCASTKSWEAVPLRTSSGRMTPKKVSKLLGMSSICRAFRRVNGIVSSTEVRLLERLHHQNIISFHGSWVNRERQEVNFVTEILSSGTLKSFINKVQVIRWKIAKRWAIQILKGLEYLHLQDPPVIHRDLKCDNIFINGTSGDLRIGDLGLSTVSQNGRVLSVLGTPEFMAPDMYEDTSYDERVDVYAFGMCLLEIFTKEIPYSECNNPAQIYKRYRPGRCQKFYLGSRASTLRDFIKLCLGYRNDQGEYVRPPVSELLKHPFLEKRATDDDEVVVKPP